MIKLAQKGHHVVDLTRSHSLHVFFFLIPAYLVSWNITVLIHNQLSMISFHNLH